MNSQTTAPNVLTAHDDSHAHSHSIDSSGLKQPYHLVDPSPWPLAGAAGGGLLLFGIVEWAHDISRIPFFLGLIMVLGVAFLWWRDVLRESGTPGLHTPVVRLGLRYGMTLFIASEVMFFVAFFWAYFHFALYPDHVLDVANPTWPPPGVHTFDPFGIPLLNTLILLLSGTTVTWAHHSLIEGDRKHLIMGLGLTILLGLSFTCLQAVEYSDAPFKFEGGGVYPSIFFLATGFHGFHVHRRHLLPDRLLVPCPRRRVHPGAAFRLRGRRLVLALRRRGLAVPVRRHLPGRHRVGRRAALT